MRGFTNKTVIVAGAASGIGAAAAKRFLDEGANVVDLDRPRIEKAIIEFPAERTLAHVCDTSKMDDATAAIRAAVKRFGGIDVLINDAGIGILGDV